MSFLKINSDKGKSPNSVLIKKIFEQLFTTSLAGDGTGLGLSICNDIIKAHGGVLKVESKENEFTEFVITLPL